MLKTISFLKFIYDEKKHAKESNRTTDLYNSISIGYIKYKGGMWNDLDTTYITGIFALEASLLLCVSVESFPALASTACCITSHAF